MNIKSLFASKRKVVDGVKSREDMFEAQYNIGSDMCAHLDNIIEHLQVYREDFKINRIPIYEKTFLEKQKVKASK